MHRALAEHLLVLVVLAFVLIAALRNVGDRGVAALSEASCEGVLVSDTTRSGLSSRWRPTVLVLESEDDDKESEVEDRDAERDEVVE